MKAILKSVCLCAILAFITTSAALAQHIPFQGKLLEDDLPVNGIKTFIFSIVDQGINWTETHENVPVNNGLYAVVLGSIIPLSENLFESQLPLNLNVKVGGVVLDTVQIYPPIEADPNVPENLKDGVSWNEIDNIPPNILDDTSTTNELQNLELNDQTLSITSGNSVVLPEMSLPPQMTLSDPDTIYQTCPSQLTSSVNQEISSVWQSFKACYTGVLDTILVQFANMYATGIKLRIYPGDGISAQVLYEENFPSNNFPALLQLQIIVPSNDLPITEGSKYTFQVTGISNPIYTSSANNAYNDGYSNFGADKDLKFKIINKIFVPFQFTVNGTITANQYVGVDCIPQGVIVMWSGLITNIPEGWSLCDGTNGTPDLRDRFIVGAKQDESGIAKTNVSGVLTQSGGEATHLLTSAECGIPAHTHTVVLCSTAGATPQQALGHTANSAGSVATQANIATNAQSAHNTLPPYYALAFIMKL